LVLASSSFHFAPELYAIVGGAENLQVVEWPFSFAEIETFKQTLATELRALGITGDISAMGNGHGRLIEVWVEDPSSLPEDFGSAVPDAAFCVGDGPTSVPESG
jgi:hypothetical protein